MLIGPNPPGTVLQNETVGEANGDAVESDERLAVGHNQVSSFGFQVASSKKGRLIVKSLPRNSKLATRNGI
jgi:hypothetical protein